MKHHVILFWHLLVTIAKLLKPGGIREVVAENIVLKHQLLVMTRPLKRSPKLKNSDRLIFGLCSLFLSPSRILKAAVILKPSTLLKFQKALIQKKYSSLFSSKHPRKPGPKGPSQELINAIIAIKQRNPRFGCPRIAQQINLAFGLDIDKDVVRRILEQHCKPTSGDNGPSWLTLLGHTKDSLWSIDFFRCESINLKSHWVLLVMDQFTRRIIGFSVHNGDLHGAVICRMFNRVISKQKPPKRISSDNDPLFQFHRWKANLRIRDIQEIKSVPYTPSSHPFVERLIGTVRRECLDQTFFWNSPDLEKKLGLFQDYYNQNRVHTARDGNTPADKKFKTLSLSNFSWKKHCRGLFEIPNLG